jgi:hypothetical protein
VDILNANSSTAWPLSFISFALIPQNITTPDCSNVNELLLFLSWYALRNTHAPVLARLTTTSSMARAGRS